MRCWDFNPADYELLPGDLDRIAELAECRYSHVYKSYAGKYKGKPANEDLLMVAMLAGVDFFLELTWKRGYASQC